MIQLWAKKCHGKSAEGCPGKNKRICVKGHIPVSLSLAVGIWPASQGHGFSSGHVWM